MMIITQTPTRWALRLRITPVRTISFRSRQFPVPVAHAGRTTFSIMTPMSTTQAEVEPPSPDSRGLRSRRQHPPR